MRRGRRGCRLIGRCFRLGRGWRRCCFAGRFRRFHISEIKDRAYKLDITWLKDDSLEDSDDLPEPQDLAAEAITELEAVVNDLREIMALVEKEEGVEK